MTTALSTARATITPEILSTGVRALYTAAGRDLEPAAFDVFEHALEGEMSEAEFMAAVARATRTVDGFCTPARLIRVVRELRREQTEESGDRPAEAELRELEARADAEAERRVA